MCPPIEKLLWKRTEGFRMTLLEQSLQLDLVSHPKWMIYTDRTDDSWSILWVHWCPVFSDVWNLKRHSWFWFLCSEQESLTALQCRAALVMLPRLMPTRVNNWVDLPWLSSTFVIDWLGGGGSWPWASVEKMALRYGWGVAEVRLSQWYTFEYQLSMRWVYVEYQLSRSWVWAEPTLSLSWGSFFLWVTVEVFYGLRSGWGKSAYSKLPQSIVFMVWVGFEWILSRIWVDFEWILSGFEWILSEHSNSDPIQTDLDSCPRSTDPPPLCPYEPCC